MGEAPAHQPLTAMLKNLLIKGLQLSLKSFGGYWNCELGETPMAYGSIADFASLANGSLRGKVASGINGARSCNHRDR